MYVNIRSCKRMSPCRSQLECHDCCSSASIRSPLATKWRVPLSHVSVFSAALDILRSTFPASGCYCICFDLITSEPARHILQHLQARSDVPAEFEMRAAPACCDMNGTGTCTRRRLGCFPRSCIKPSMTAESSLSRAHKNFLNLLPSYNSFIRQMG